MKRKFLVRLAVISILIFAGFFFALSYVENMTIETTGTNWYSISDKSIIVSTADYYVRIPRDNTNKLVYGIAEFEVSGVKVDHPTKSYSFLFNEIMTEDHKEFWLTEYEGNLISRIYQKILRFLKLGDVGTYNTETYTGTTNIVFANKNVLVVELEGNASAKNRANALLRGYFVFWKDRPYFYWQPEYELYGGLYEEMQNVIYFDEKWATDTYTLNYTGDVVHNPYFRSITDPRWCVDITHEMLENKSSFDWIDLHNLDLNKSVGIIILQCEPFFSVERTLLREWQVNPKPVPKVNNKFTDSKMDIANYLPPSNVSMHYLVYIHNGSYKRTQEMASNLFTNLYKEKTYLTNYTSCGFQWFDVGNTLGQIVAGRYGFGIGFWKGQLSLQCNDNARFCNFKGVYANGTMSLIQNSTSNSYFRWYSPQSNEKIWDYTTVTPYSQVLNESGKHVLFFANTSLTEGFSILSEWYLETWNDTGTFILNASFKTTDDVNLSYFGFGFDVPSIMTYKNLINNTTVFWGYNDPWLGQRGILISVTGGSYKNLEIDENKIIVEVVNNTRDMKYAPDKVLGNFTMRLTLHYGYITNENEIPELHYLPDVKEWTRNQHWWIYPTLVDTQIFSIENLDISKVPFINCSNGSLNLTLLGTGEMRGKINQTTNDVWVINESGIEYTLQLPDNILTIFSYNTAAQYIRILRMPMSISPSEGSVNVTILKYEPDVEIEFREESSVQQAVTHSIKDLKPDKWYTIYCDGKVLESIKMDITGTLNFTFGDTSDEVWSNAHIFKITKLSEEEKEVED